MNKKLSAFLIVIFFLVVFILLAFQSGFSHKVKIDDIKFVILSGVKLKVDLAITMEDQVQGLSGRSGLKDDEGMLFVFPELGKYNFWMKDMNFPIDIIWLDENGKVIYIKKNAKPEDYPSQYGPDQNVPTESRGSSIGKAIGTKYVLEVVSGFSDKNNLQVGDMAEFAH